MAEAAVCCARICSDPTKWDLVTLDGALRTLDGRSVLVRHKELGRGTYGAVASFRHEPTKQQVAVKMVGQDSRKEALSAEFDIGRHLRHPNVCSLFGAFRTGIHYVFVMEFVDGGDLYHKVANGTPISPATGCKYLLQLVDALEYMHSRGVVHCDLKLENVVLTADEQFCKIIDFGMSMWLVSDRVKKTPTCYNACIAPEQCLASSFGRSVDVWALGPVLYMSLTSALPFPSAPKDPHRAVKMYKRGPEAGTPKFKALPQHAQDLILRIMKFRPEDRPTLAEVRQSEFVLSFPADASAQVPSEAVEYQSSTTLQDDVVLEVAQYVPQSLAVLRKACTEPQANNDASMLYNMLINRNAKTDFGAP